MLELMSKAGCWMISYGIESADQRILDKAGKKVDISRASWAVNGAKKWGMHVVGHFIFGLPGETEQSAASTIQLAKSLNLDLAQFYCAVPFPGSPLYEEAKSKGWLKNESWADFRQDRAVMNLSSLSSISINDLRRKAIKSFYCRPKTILNNIKLLEIKNPKQAIESGIKFFHWLKQ